MEAKNSIAFAACKDGLRGRGGGGRDLITPHTQHTKTEVWWWHSVPWWGESLTATSLCTSSPSEKGNRNKKEEIFRMLCLALVTYHILLLALSLGECYSHGNRGMKGSLQLPKSKREKCLWHAACCSSCYKFTGRFPTVTELNPNILLSERLEHPLIRLLIGLSLFFSICHIRKPTAVPKWAFQSNVQDIIRSLWKGTVLNSVINIWYYCLPNLANGFSGDPVFIKLPPSRQILIGMPTLHSANEGMPLLSKTLFLKTVVQFLHYSLECLVLTEQLSLRFLLSTLNSLSCRVCVMWWQLRAVTYDYAWLLISWHVD